MLMKYIIIKIPLYSKFIHDNLIPEHCTRVKYHTQDSDCESIKQYIQKGSDSESINNNQTLTVSPINYHYNSDCEFIA